MSMHQVEAELAEAELATAQQEEQEAEQALQDAEVRLANARRRKERLLTYLEVASELASRTRPPPASGNGVASGDTSGDAVRSPAVTSRHAARAAVVSILEDRGRRIPTRDLVELLRDMDIAVGKRPERAVVDLSAALSMEPQLRANREAGWGLKEWDGKGPKET